MRFAHAVSMIALLAFASPAFADEYVVMKVNGQDISSSEVQRMWEGLFPPGQAQPFDAAKPEVRERVMRAVMAEKLIYGEALKAGTDKSEKVARELEDVKHKVVVRNFLDAKTTDMITDASLKKEYESTIAGLKDEKEVRARHILVPTEAEAKEAKKKLDSGKSFEEVAKEFSKDAGSAKNGGDLGYFTKEKMVKEFADAAFAMKKGEISSPVKSGFGYHVIKIEDVRKAPAPTFAEMKEQLKAQMQEKKLNDYVTAIVKAADVKAFDAKGKEIAFNKYMGEEGKPAEAAKADAKADKAEPAAGKAAEKAESPAKADKKPQ